MRDFLYYASLLLLGFAWYMFGQKLLRKGLRDENDQLTKGVVGPVGFLMAAGISCYLFFGMLRALVRGEVPCLGKGCTGQIYTLAANPGEFWANVFFMAWMVAALAYALYVTLRIWFRA
ncbi:hypothetical protein [uncultured Variovorax sp.]|uniref:hypothetical protein n=1 Tax=uncultured Variovorax sp. TaxID=114708 RepID=UPI0025DCAE62|nr:hypothetical protein [uncultured Variovorax sp.]